MRSPTTTGGGSSAHGMVMAPNPLCVAGAFSRRQICWLIDDLEHRYPRRPVVRAANNARPRVGAVRLRCYPVVQCGRGTAWAEKRHRSCQTDVGAVPDTR